MHPDAHIQKVLAPCPWLYGRRNQLLLADERVIAEIVEFSHPVDANDQRVLSMKI